MPSTSLLRPHPKMFLDQEDLLSLTGGGGVNQASFALCLSLSQVSSTSSFSRTHTHTLSIASARRSLLEGVHWNTALLDTHTNIHTRAPLLRCDLIVATSLQRPIHMHHQTLQLTSTSTCGDSYTAFCRGNQDTVYYVFDIL